MKRTQEILDLPIISISDGIERGKVRNIIINADKGAIDYMLVDSGIQILSAIVIPSENILGIGKNALTIETEHAIVDISKLPEAIDLLQKNVPVKGTKVLTKKGRLVGEIGDFYVDDDDLCKIIGLEFIAEGNKDNIKIIPKDSVITLGKNLIVVVEDLESTLLDNPRQLISKDIPGEIEKKNLSELSSEAQLPGTIPVNEDEVSNNLDGELNEADRIIAADGEDFIKESSPSISETVNQYIDENNQVDESLDVVDTLDLSAFESPKADESSSEQVPETLIEEKVEKKAEEPTKTNSAGEGLKTSAADLFEQKQRQYLNGRKATKTITDNSGNVIIGEGAMITEGIIDIAKNSGKLIELVMNNKA
ncbi:MAG: hypothetical protein N2645_15050 [Clostridia bacterium]|nr:hypothetical protein [Clostridia bacterium]